MKSWLTILISVPLGAISSLIAWWVLNYCVKPKIKFSNNISKSIHKSKAIYRFKFENSTKRRMVDAEIVAKLRIKGLIYSTNWEVLYLPIDNERIPIINSRNKLREVLRLELDLIDNRYKRFLPSDVRGKIENSELELEDLFGLGEKSELILIVSGYDEKSGVKKIFESNPYTIRSIKIGQFNVNNLEIK